MKTTQPLTHQVDISTKQQDTKNTANGGTNQQSAPKREIQISQATKERAEALKAYVESIHYLFSHISRLPTLR